MKTAAVATYPLRANHKSDGRRVLGAAARLGRRLDSSELVIADLLVLALVHSVSEEDDPLGRLFVVLLEGLQVLLHHLLETTDDLPGFVSAAAALCNGLQG